MPTVTNRTVGGNASAEPGRYWAGAAAPLGAVGAADSSSAGCSPADRPIGARPRSLAITWMALAAGTASRPHKTAEVTDDPAQLDTYEDRQQHPEGFNRTVRSSHWIQDVFSSC